MAKKSSLQLKSSGSQKKKSVHLTKVFISFGILAIVGIVSILLLTSTSSGRTHLKTTSEPPTSVSGTFLSPKKWVDYKDDTISFKHPESWRLVDSSKLGPLTNFLVVSPDCNPKLFTDEKNPSVSFVLEHREYWQAEESVPCWFRQKSSGRTINRPLELENGDHIISSVLYAKDELIIEQYTFTADFNDQGRHNLYLIAPSKYADNIEPIFAELLLSFRYLKKYQAKTPTQWEKFTSKYGFSFEYPLEWGEVDESLKDLNDPSGPSQTGKVYSLRFSLQSNSRIANASGIGQSPDFSAARGGFYNDYQGEPEKPIGVTSEVLTGLALSCSSWSTPKYTPFIGVIKFNLKRDDVGGVMLELPLLAEEDKSTFESQVDEFAALEKTCQNPTGTVPPSIVAKEKEITNAILSGYNLSDESQIYINIFKHIRDSARIN